jgi:hypothetical protein
MDWLTSPILLSGGLASPVGNHGMGLVVKISGAGWDGLRNRIA